MTTLHLHNRAAAFLATLDRLDPGELHDAFANEAIETGGTIADDGNRTKITLHDLTVIGDTPAGAMHLWMRIARSRIARIEGDGFTTVHPPFPDPRNHAEEIENARAGFDRELRRC